MRHIPLKRISILLVALLALVVAACTSEEAASPSATTEPTESAAPSEEPTIEPDESEDASASADPGGSLGAIPSFGLGDMVCQDDNELANVLPESVGGQPLQVLCMSGDLFAGAGGADPAFQEFLDSVDAEASDMSVAFGGSLDGSTGVVAFRIEGVPEDELEEQFLNANEAQGEIADVQQQNIGGKDVWSATSTDPSTPGTAFIYVKDDTVYFLTGTNEQAAEILGALP